ncbi:SsgA family sporulation/cell division regulator [Streptomyces brasiliensis]|uniref:Sporulation protein SsgA n=1 Tax=Streptomyces brasiliensis TaxID=1954 RepID=A0A917NU70_9ACTN|nr:SsgA family sporulation/cell division regulator [Streptomyces brasiliensis]GGJ28917.1 sporulation protein SsgA [Streptomyces brasiliensis]
MRKCHRTIQITQWAARRLPLPIACEFAFNSGDPLAVTLVFDSDGEYPVRWVFARDLLAEGLTARSGQGDVEIWPVYRAGRRSLWIQVGKARTGRTALFEVPARPVAQWLAQSYAVVPRGREMADVDWSELTQMIQ